MIVITQKEILMDLGQIEKASHGFYVPKTARELSAMMRLTILESLPEKSQARFRNSIPDTDHPPKGYVVFRYAGNGKGKTYPLAQSSRHQPYRLFVVEVDEVGGACHIGRIEGNLLRPLAMSGRYDDHLGIALNEASGGVFDPNTPVHSRIQFRYPTAPELELAIRAISLGMGEFPDHNACNPSTHISNMIKQKEQGPTVKLTKLRVGELASAAAETPPSVP